MQKMAWGKRHGWFGKLLWRRLEKGKESKSAASPTGRDTAEEIRKVTSSDRFQKV
jgi:hypothetical protein